MISNCVWPVVLYSTPQMENISIIAESSVGQYCCRIKLFYCQLLILKKCASKNTTVGGGTGRILCHRCIWQHWACYKRSSRGLACSLVAQVVSWTPSGGSCQIHWTTIRQENNSVYETFCRCFQLFPTFATVLMVSFEQEHRRNLRKLHPLSFPLK